LNDSRAYILNTALTTRNASGGNEAAPNLVDFLNIRTEVYEARVDIDQGLPADFYEPQDMALTEDESMLVVVSRGADRQFFPNGILPHLTLIDTQGARVLRRINLGVEDYPSSLVLSPDGRLAYVSAAQKAGGQGGVVGAQLVVVDLQTNQVVDRLVLPFTGGLGAGEIVITPDGGLLVLILNDGQFGTSVMKLAFIDTATVTISATFPTPDTPFNTARMIGNPKNLAMDPSGSKVYMAEARASFEDDTQGIAVIDVATAQMIGVIPMPGTRSGGDPDVQMAANGQLIVETNARTGTVTVVDALTHEIRDQEKIYDTFFNSALSEGP
jgi:DNA-binding beta-propeller fold protein YncE